MTSAVKPLSFATHGQIKIKQSNRFPHAKNEQVAPIIAHEFYRACAEMPIVFVKNSETGAFQPVVLMGFKSGENVFFEGDKWCGNYLPAIMSHHPFALMPSENDPNQLQVFIREDNELLSLEEGEALFDDDGQETDYLKQRKSAVGSYFDNTRITKDFVQHLVDKSLFTQQNLSLTLNDEKFDINGVYLVDDKALNELSDEDFLTLRKKGYLSVIYNHLSSLHQLGKLAELKTK